MKVINLASRSDPGAVTVVDDEDYPFISQWNWRLSDNGYAIRHVSHQGKKYVIRMHRVLAGAPEGAQVDHVNGDRLDNRRANLRLATNRENSCNRNRRRKVLVRLKGVYQTRSGNRWYSRIRVSGRAIYLGTFDSKEDAARAYDKAAKMHHGRFAVLNFEWQSTAETGPDLPGIPQGDLK